MRFEGYGLTINGHCIAASRVRDHVEALSDYFKDTYGCGPVIITVGGELQELDPPVVPISGEDAERALVNRVQPAEGKDVLAEDAGIRSSSRD